MIGIKELQKENRFKFCCYKKGISTQFSFISNSASCLFMIIKKEYFIRTARQNKLASSPFPRFLLQEVHWIFLRFQWVCTRTPAILYKWLCESATEKLRLVPSSFVLVSREENVFSELFKNDAVNQRQRHQVIY